MPQVKYTADGLPYYDATDQQAQPYFPQANGGMLPAPGVPGTPSEGWNQGVRDTLHGMTIGPVQDAAKALQGQMTGQEAQDFAFGAAMGLIPMRRAMQGIRAYHGSPHDFDRFDMSKAGSTTDPGALGRGIYLSTDKAVAEGIELKGSGRIGEKPHKYEVQVNAQNPLELSHPPGKMSMGPAQRISDVSRALGLEPPKNQQEWAKWADDVAVAAKAKGHDAITYDMSPVGYNHKEISVFDDKLIDIVKKYGWAAIAPLLGLTAENLSIPKAQAPQL